MKHLTRWRTVTAAAASTALAFGALGIASAMNDDGPERIELATDQSDGAGERVVPLVEPSSDSVISQTSATETNASGAEADDGDTATLSPTAEDVSLESEADDNAVASATQGEAAVNEQDASVSPPSVASTESSSIESSSIESSSIESSEEDDDDGVETLDEIETDDSGFSVESTDSVDEDDDDDEDSDED